MPEQIHFTHRSATNFAAKLVSQQAGRVSRSLHKSQIPLRTQLIVSLIQLDVARLVVESSLPLS